MFKLIRDKYLINMDKVDFISKVDIEKPDFCSIDIIINGGCIDLDFGDKKERDQFFNELHNELNKDKYYYIPVKELDNG